MSTETESECELCGRLFETDHGVAMHKAYSHDNPWQDEEKLLREYVDNGRSMVEIAEEWGCDSSTVGNWLDRFGIEKREAKDYNRVEYVRHTTHPQGYEMWRHDYGEDRGAIVYIHRLLAAAKYGLDALSGMHVHHLNGVVWDNRPDNIELRTPEEHIKEHQENGDVPVGPKAQRKGGYDPRGLFVGVANEERYRGMYAESELQNEL